MYFEIARTVCIIKPKVAFLEWLRKVPGSDLSDVALDQLRIDCSALLIPQFARLEDAVTYIDGLHEQIFEMELATWADEEHWPPQRSLQLFWEWFDVEFHSNVIDVAGEEEQRRVIPLHAVE